MRGYGNCSSRGHSLSIAHAFRPILELVTAVSQRTLLALTGLGAVIFGISLAIDAPGLRIAGLTSGAALVLLGLLVAVLGIILRQLCQRDQRLITQLCAETNSACLLCDMRDGRILWRNAQAETACETDDLRISGTLQGLCADPDRLAARLHDLALGEGTTTHLACDGNEQRSYRITAISESIALWQIDTDALVDPRDALAMDIAQFGADGTASYLSPNLRKIWPEAQSDLQAIVTTYDLQPGQTRRIRLAPQGEWRNALRLPSDANRLETLVFLPDPGATGAAPDPVATGNTALEQMPVALAHIGADGRFTYLNHEARKLLRQRNDAENALLSDTLEGLGRPVLEWVSDVATGRLARATEVLRLNRADAETYLKVTLSRIPDPQTTDVVAVLNDVTELKSLEAKFTQSQKMQAIGQLAGGVAHDFNNLLTAISGHCDLLLLRHDRSDLDYPDLMQIQQNTNRAAALVRQLLALSRQQTLKFVTLDLTETMNDVIHLLNRLVGEKITLTLRHGENVAPIRSDKRQFEQVLMNLVVNARDALPMGGEIRIETATQTFPHGKKHDQVHLPAGDYTIIKISDDGTGIPQSLLPKVFDPFFTTKRPGDGTGLGLSTVYGIIKQSGGFIFVESEEGVGTTFTLYFTAQDPAIAAPAAEKSASRLPPPALKARRALVLLVEDEAPVRSFAARALELQGHRVIEADCGEAALDILDNPDIKPDFFITDVIMPGLDGPSWVAQVRDRFPDIPVLFMSGYAEDSRVAAQARISNAQFLGKPFSLAEFTDTVYAQLQRDSEAA